MRPNEKKIYRGINFAKEKLPAASDIELAITLNKIWAKDFWEVPPKASLYTFKVPLLKKEWWFNCFEFTTKPFEQNLSFDKAKESE